MRSSGPFLLRYGMMTLTGVACLGVLSLVCTQRVTGASPPPPAPGRISVEYGIDRSNMGTQWTLS
jgi:hypothetical protein